jgi:SAM-dependent methyltransferase
MAETTEYRTRIYAQYGSRFQDAPATFDLDRARRWGRACDHYLRGWLPERKNASIVDLACGGGNLLQFFQDRGYSNVAGVDISPEQVQLSRQVVRHVEQEDVLVYLARHERKFDLITALDLIEHFKKDEVLMFLDRCFRALAPGGRLILSTPNAESPWGSVCRYGDFTHEVGFNPDALHRVMSLVGFEDLASREGGPIPFGYSMVSSIRYVLWKMIWAGLGAWNLVETGTLGSGVYTRVFLVSGKKPF